MVLTAGVCVCAKLDQIECVREITPRELYGANLTIARN